MKKKKVKIFRNSTNKTTEVERKVIEELNKNDFKLVQENYDLAISIGGDGTFLKMVNETNFKEVLYYVGINTGNLGFLQELTTDDYEKFIQDLANDILIEDTKSLEEIIVTTKYKTISYFALNEVVIRNKNLKALETDIKIDNVLLEEFVGDGILISTNVGSTAYNMSLGGSIIDKEIQALSLTPIAPLKNARYHNLDNSIILSSKRVIELIPTSPNLILTFDGKNEEIENVIKIEVKLSNRKIKCLTTQNNNFIKTIHNKIIG